MPLRGSPSEVTDRERILSAAELERAARFHYASDRTAYVMARSALRLLLGRYLGLSPETLEFIYGPFGKPALASGFKTGLQFNLSHAGGYALLGFTTGANIGVDLEAEDDTIEIVPLTRRFFSPGESKQVLALPANEQVATFFRTWTRKEAFLKANGAGLSLPLEQFSVTVALQEPVSLERIDWAPNTVTDWAMASLEVAAGLPGAVVVKGDIRELVFYNNFRLSDR